MQTSSALTSSRAEALTAKRDLFQKTFPPKYLDYRGGSP